MPEPDLFLLFVRPFNRLGIRYIIGGSVAATFYGEPRITHDVDMVVFLNETSALQMTQTFSSPDFYMPPVEAILPEIRRVDRGHFNIIHNQTGFKADIYLVGRDELSAWGFRNKRMIEFQGETVILAPPEYVIVRKLEYYRDGGSDKHLRDIRGMVALSESQLDCSALNEWIQRMSLEKEWALATG